MLLSSEPDMIHSPPSHRTQYRRTTRLVDIIHKKEVICNKNLSKQTESRPGKTGLYARRSCLLIQFLHWAGQKARHTASHHAKAICRFNAERLFLRLLYCGVYCVKKAYRFRSEHCFQFFKGAYFGSGTERGNGYI